MYPILDGTLRQITRITSKREPEPGDTLQLYYRNFHEKTCYTCLNAGIVTGGKCPLFDNSKYSKDMRCPSFVNFLKNVRVTEIRKYESFYGIVDVDTWAKDQGFANVGEAKNHYCRLMGTEWESYPLTVILW